MLLFLLAILAILAFAAYYFGINRILGELAFPYSTYLFFIRPLHFPSEILVEVCHPALLLCLSLATCYFLNGIRTGK